MLSDVKKELFNMGNKTNNIKLFLKNNRLLAIILFVTFIISLSRFMTMPFMIIYFKNNLDLTASQIGFLVGLSPLSSLIFGVFSGRIADKLGSFITLPISLLIPAIALIGYIHIHNFYLLCSLALISGISWSVYNAVNMTIITNLSIEENRETVFGYNYWFFNLGAIAGPSLATYFGAGESALVIYLFSITLVLISLPLYLYLKLKFNSEKKNKKDYIDLKQQKQNNLISTFKTIGLDKPLLCLTTASFLLFFIGAQLETTLGVFLETSYGEKGISTFGYSLSMSALIILIFQPIVVKYLKNLSNKITFFIGGIILSIGPFLFIILNKPEYFLLATSLLSVGEVVITPKLQALLSKLPRQNLQSTYFSFFNMSGNLAYFVGPWLGSYLLGYNSLFLFILMGSISICCGLFLILSDYYYHKNKSHIEERNAKKVNINEY